MKLELHHIEFIVRCVADFMRPREVVEEFEREFGKPRHRSDRLRPQQVSYYDATNVCGSPTGPAKQWQELFWKLREDASNRLRDIPVANPINRLRQLQRLVDKNIDSLDPARAGLALRALDQAAKELGDLKIPSTDLYVNILQGYEPAQIERRQYIELLRELPDPTVGAIPVPSTVVDQDPAGSTDGSGAGVEGSEGTEASSHAA